MTFEKKGRSPDKSAEPADFSASPQEAASYIRDMLVGLRRLTGASVDLRVIDYILAIAQEEADSVSSTQYH